MTSDAAPTSLLRASHSHEDSRVGYAELFFDLVFVFAITQLSHSLLHHLSWKGLAETAFLFLAVWWVWVYTTWVTNWLDPQRAPVRLMLFVLMLAGLLLSISIPEAFGERSLLFAFAYVFMQVARSLFMCWALWGKREANFRNFVRITVWLAFSGVFWIAGAFAEHELRYGLWGAALLIEYISPSLGFWTPFLGRSTTMDWDVSGAHFAERCGLFMIIALGESLLVTGATFAEIEWSGVSLSAFLVAFVGAVAMWWVYFDIGAERASVRIAKSDDPGRIARLAYTYLHLPIVAGVILTAVSDELILAHPLGHMAPLAVLAILGGPAVFLAGNLFFKRAVFGRFARSHMAGLVALAGAALASPVAQPLSLAAFATLVLIVVGAWENVAVKGRGRLRAG